MVEVIARSVREIHSIVTVLGEEEAVAVLARGTLSSVKSSLGGSGQRLGHYGPRLIAASLRDEAPLERWSWVLRRGRTVWW
jgi:hypothetical protein